MKHKLAKVLIAAGLLATVPLNELYILSISAEVNENFASNKGSLLFSIAEKNYVEMDKPLDSIPNTFETWVKTEMVGKRQIIFGNYVYQKNGFALEITADNKLRWYEAVWENGVNTSLIDVKVDAPDVFDGNWNHVSVIRDVENNKIIFLNNGVVLQEVAIEKTGLNILKEKVVLDQSHFVGSDPRKSYFFEGEISQIKTWNTKRSAEEINSTMNTPIQGNEVGLQSCWEFNINELNTESNIIVNKKANGPIGTTTNFVLPKKRTSLNFDSLLKTSVELDKVLEVAPKTIEFWAKFDKKPNKRQLVFSNYVIGKNGMGIELTAENQLRYVEFGYTGSNPTASVDIKTLGKDICTGEWAHYAIIRDVENNKITFMKDKEVLLEKELEGGTISLTADLTFTNKHYFGTDTRNNYYLDGEIDEFTLWNDTKTKENIIANMDAKITGQESTLQHSWNFDFNELNTVANVITDKKANGINAKTVNFTLPNAPQYTKDGTSFAEGSIEIEMSKNLEEAPVTFETWLKMPKTGSATRGGVIAGNLFDSYYTGIPIVNFEIFSGGVPRLYWKIDGNEFDYKANGVNVCTGEWVHLALSYNKDEKKMTTYVNGEALHSETLDFTPSKLNQPFKIGKDSRDSQNFKGELSDLRIWSTNRSAEQIKENFDKQVNINEQGLLGNWILDEDQNGVYSDRSINQNDATNYWVSGDLFAKSTEGYGSVAVIPDTQTMSMSYPTSYTKMTTWLKDNAKSLGIGAAIHVGDIVNTNASQSEWDRAVASMNVLDGVIPYVFSYGNHDVALQNIDGKWWGTRNAAMMNKNLPYSKFSKEETFGGAYEKGKMDNTYSYFTINNVDLMTISLEEAPRDEVLEWASKITEENPDRRVIVTTHEYMYYDGNPTTDKSQDHLGFIGGSSTGEEMWQKYVKKHKNIIAVVSGHVGYPDLLMSERTGDEGNQVQQILCDAQFMDRDDIANGSKKGLGMVMLLFFKEGSDDVKINWYSTVRNQFFRSRNQFDSKLNLTSQLEVDKKALNKIISTVESTVKTDVYKKAILSSRTAIDKALKEAKDIAIDDNASQSEINKMVNKLNVCLKNLEKQIGNKKDLNDNYIKYQKYILADYQDGANKEAFKKALNDANEMIKNEEAQQPEVDLCNKELVQSAEVLIKDEGRKNLLELLEKVIGYQEPSYVQGWLEFVSARADAQNLVNDKNATQGEVAQKLSKLKTVVENLKRKAFVDNLKHLLNEIAKENLGNYIQKDVDELSLIIKESKELLSNEVLSEDSQEVVDSLYRQLNEKWKAMKITTEEKNEQPPKTDDNSIPLTSAVSTMLISGWLIMNFLKKRR